MNILKSQRRHLSKIEFFHFNYRQIGSVRFSNNTFYRYRFTHRNDKAGIRAIFRYYIQSCPRSNFDQNIPLCSCRYQCIDILSSRVIDFYNIGTRKHIGQSCYIIFIEECRPVISLPMISRQCGQIFKKKSIIS